MSNVISVYKSQEFLEQLQSKFLDFISVDDKAISHLIKLSSLKTDKTYVLKVLNPRYSDGYWKEAFCREITILNKISNLEHIIEMLDNGEIMLPPPFYEVKYLAVEYLEYSLNDIIYNKRVNLIVYLKIFKELLITINDLYKLGFYHRDIKPSNIMLSMSTGSFSPKFIDFGCSYEKGTKRILSIETAKENYSLPLSDRRYAALELFCGFNKYPNFFFKADLFSLGAVLFECLTKQVFTSLFYNTAALEGISELFFRLKDENKRLDNYLKILNYIENNWNRPSLRDYIIDPLEHETIDELEYLINILTDLNFTKRHGDVQNIIFRVDLIINKLQRGCLS